MQIEREEVIGRVRQRETKMELERERIIESGRQRVMKIGREKLMEEEEEELESPSSGMSSPEARLGMQVEDLWDIQEPQLTPTEKLNACFESIPVSSFPPAPSSQGTSNIYFRLSYYYYYYYNYNYCCCVLLVNRLYALSRFYIVTIWVMIYCKF